MSASEESNKGLTQRRLKKLSGLEQNELKDGSCWFKEDSYKDCDSSSVERVRHLLSKASKRGTADRGVPDFLWIDQKTNIAIVVECKGPVNRHTPSGVELDDISRLLSSQKSVEEYATSGALWFAKFLNRDYDVVAVATSGADESSYRCTTYLVAREDDISGAKLLERETVFSKALSTPESYKDEFDEKFNRLSESEQQTLKNLNTYARACNRYLRKNRISAKDRAGFLAAILLVLTYDEGSISKTAQKVSEGLANDDAIENLDLFDKNLPSTFLEQLKNVWEDDDVPESKRKMLDKYYRGIIGPELMRAPEDSSKRFPKLSSFLASIIVSLYENVYKPLKLNEQQPKIDVMASFYTSFLKFARGDAKDKGIVLTPRHVCDLFMGIAEWALHRKLNENTPVVDICCGTGSFLIAAMNRMDANIDRNGASPETRKQQKSMVRDNCLMGADSEPEMFALSYANMRFHGDGKSHLYCCSSLEKDRTVTTADGKTETPEAGTALVVKKNRVNLDDALTMAVKDGADEHAVPDVDKPLVGCINPPYSLDARDSSELDFTLSLLDMLQPGGVGIVILPISSACSKGKALRKKIMEKHSLIGCMSMPINLFHDSHVNTSTCIMVWRVGTPQAESTEPLFLGRWADDGFVTIPHRGRIDANGAWARRRTEWMSQLKGFVKDPKKCLNVQINMKRGSAPVKGVNSEGVRVIGYADDVVPEAYLDADFNLVTQESLRNRLLDYALHCYMNDTGELDFNTAFRSILSTDYEDFNDKYGAAVDSHGKPVFPLSLKTAMFRLDSLFDVKYGVNLEKADLEDDEEGILFVGRSAYGNGVTGRVAQIDNVTPQPAGTISVAGGGSVLSSFVQREPWYSGRDVYVLTPKKPMSKATKTFICALIKNHDQQFSYGRQANKFIPSLEIPLPISPDGNPDFRAVDSYMNSLSFSKSLLR